MAAIPTAISAPFHAACNPLMGGFNDGGPCVVSPAVRRATIFVCTSLTSSCGLSLTVSARRSCMGVATHVAPVDGLVVGTRRTRLGGTGVRGAFFTPTWFATSISGIERSTREISVLLNATASSDVTSAIMGSYTAVRYPDCRHASMARIR